MVKLIGPEKYRLTCTPDKYTVSCERGTSKFGAIAQSQWPKLYIVSEGQVVHYVGVTKQKMTARFGLGWRAKGETGYYGYAWRRKIGLANLHIWGDEASGPDRVMLDLETIEAEVVYLVRAKGQWPLHQTEIHFHPSAEHHRQIALDVLAELTA